jgi:NTE family protein
MRPIRVALSGSGFKFPAHVGALLAIRDAGFTPVEYAGTSGGSIVSALAASGMDLDAMKSLTLTRDWSDMLTLSPLSLLAGKGFCSGNALLEWMTEQTKGLTFNDLAASLTIMASDASTETGFEFSSKTTGDTPIAFAARCSACIPAVYAAVPFKGAVLQDGGLVNNIPVDKLVVDAIPRIGIQLVSKTAPITNGAATLTDLLMRDLNMTLCANENTHVDLDEHAGAHFAFVETGYAGGLDRNTLRVIRQRLLDDGYAVTSKAVAGIAAN